jgi:hypothetical protein
MQSPYSFIVRPVKGRRYDNIKNIGGIDFITSSSKEDHVASNRFGEVIALPLDYKGDVKINDILLVHHNVFKFYFDMQGREKSGKSFFMEDMFLVDNDQFYLYYQNGKWNAHSKYCFIEPVKAKESFLGKTGKEEPLVGKVKYINKELLQLGVNIGDEISFTPESEYEFLINDQKLYRMYTNNITMIL